jgi:hypothetical protein
VSHTFNLSSDLGNSFAFDEQNLLLPLDDDDIKNCDASFSIDEIMKQKSQNNLDALGLIESPLPGTTASNGPFGTFLLGPLRQLTKKAFGRNDDDDAPMSNTNGQESAAAAQQSSSHLLGAAYAPSNAAVYV